MNSTDQDAVQSVYRMLLGSPERVKLIDAADAQLKAFADNPQHYRLPKVYQWMKPLLENFSDDQEGWLDLIRAIVESFPKRSDDRMDMRPPLRRAESRVDQQLRRRRVRMALDAYEKTHGAFPDRESRDQYARDIFGLWKVQRSNVIGKIKGKGSHHDRAVACRDFWKDVEAQCAAGVVPSVAELKRWVEQARSVYELIYGKPPKDWK